MSLRRFKPMSLYCAFSQSAQLVKVGVTSNIEARLYGLRLVDRDLVVVRLWALKAESISGVLSTERLVHKALRSRGEAVRGREWFRMSKGEAIRFICLALANERRADDALTRWFQRLEALTEAA